MVRLIIRSIVFVVLIAACCSAADGRKAGLMVSLGGGSGVYFNSNDGREDIGYLLHSGIGYCFGKRNALLVERQYYIYQRGACWCMWSSLGGSYRHYWMSKQQLYTSLGVYEESWYDGQEIWSITAGLGVEFTRDLFIGIKWLGNRYNKDEWWDADMFALELSFQHTLDIF